MKKIESCEVVNCIPTPSTCIDWFGGNIEFLEICQGDKLDNVIWEIVGKLQDLEGEDLSTFDIDPLLDICGQKAPSEIGITSILTLIKNNEVCLNDKIGTINDLLAELSLDSALNVNLKCYATRDNLGNVLSITRDQFDQLVVDNLCSHKGRIEGLEGLYTTLQNQVNNINITPLPTELSFATCINASVLPTSTQVVNTSTALCDLIDEVGTIVDIPAALSKTPADWNTNYGLIAGWDAAPSNWADNYGNLLLVIANLEARIEFMEENCCALTCDDVELGFTAIYNEDNTGVIIRFTSGAGTSIPNGFTDLGSTGTITDIDGNTETFNIDILDNLSGNETEVIISGLNLTGDLTITITSKIGTEGLTCEKCLTKVVKKATCDYCEICANGADNSSIVIVYETSGSTSASLYETTTSTTTTTTAAP